MKAVASKNYPNINGSFEKIDYFSSLVINLSVFVKGTLMQI